ncbi:MAG: hypothetical protein KAT34_22380 [Candidatus Aminicenantes bacterium]|nr:hypothetical protein [Candidatus Aminicenantes bacterium]
MMSNKSESKHVWTFIFWGSLWGLAEATFGSLFHILPWIAGFFMFPIGFYFMKKALNDSGKLVSIFYTASIAAGIKLTGLFFPFQHPAKVLNPAASIMMEAAAVILFFSIFNYEKGHFKLREILTVTLGWRLIFITYHLALLSFSLYDGFLQMSMITLARFLLFETIINALMVSLFLQAEKSGQEAVFTRFLKPGLINSFVLLTAAVAAELVL